MRVVVDAIDNYAANTVDLTHRAYGLCQLLGAAGTTARPLISIAIRRLQPTKTSVYAATIANEDLPMDEKFIFCPLLHHHSPSKRASQQNIGLKSSKHAL